VTTAHTTSKIALGYFAMAGTDYVPLDLGFVSTIVERSRRPFHAEILPLTYQYRTSEAEARHDVARDCDRILASRPRAVFLAVENVLWSKVFALGRAKRVAAEIRRRAPELFVGIQSYKVQPDQVHQLFESNLADCVVLGNPEDALAQVGQVLDRRPVPGVVYPERPPQEGSGREGPAAGGDLEGLASPYLTHVFDDFLREMQAARQHGFRAFLASSRGCSFGCFYCFRSVKFDRVRLFSVERFFDEMEYLLDGFGVTTFFVLDDAFLYSKERLREFAVEFRARSRRNPKLAAVRLHLMARPESIDAEVAGLLSELQTSWIQIGLQTVHPDLQRYMARRVPVAHFRSIAGWLHERKIGLLVDVIMGLPGDSISTFRETLDYALSLRPISMQVKQLYLNANTLFSVERDKYGIRVEESEREFDAPYVVAASGLEESYFGEATDLVMRRIEAHPEVWWKFLGREKWFVSPWRHPR
jgi:tRNA A37 methylthiotransferase MiaB